MAIRFLTSAPNFKNGQLLRLGGYIYSEPNVSSRGVNFNLSGIAVSLKTEIEVHYGDFVVVEGVYKDGKVIASKINEFKESQNLLVNIRKRLLYFYKSSLPEPHASLVAGITIGAKSGLSKNFSDKLKSSGTSHVVVASGMNITMVGQFVLSLLLIFLSRKKSLIFSLILIWIYTAIAGFEAPIVRAVIMASIVFIGEIFGRVNNTLRYLGLSAFVMLLIVPSWIADVGFLLSFATTLSLVLFESKISRLISFVPSIIKEDLSTSIAAQIGSAPILFYFFGSFNILSPFINTLVLWTVAPIMIIGGVSGILSFVFPGLARIILQLAYPLTAWFVSVILL